MVKVSPLLTIILLRESLVDVVVNAEATLCNQLRPLSARVLLLVERGGSDKRGDRRRRGDMRTCPAQEGR
jgi:hypothetical protein